MSRIGNAPITVPEGVEVNISPENKVHVKGKLGELTQDVNPLIKIVLEDNTITLSRPNDDKDTRSIHGLYRSLLFNMIFGVSEGFVIEQELVGVGYRAALKGNQLNLQLGYSHDINFDIPEGIKINVEKQTTLKISGADKQQVGAIASKLKTLRKIEPYKGKGVREKGQHILKKEGKKK